MVDGPVPGDAAYENPDALLDSCPPNPHIPTEYRIRLEGIDAATDAIARRLHAEFLQPAAPMNGIESRDFDTFTDKANLYRLAAEIREIAKTSL